MVVVMLMLTWLLVSVENTLDWLPSNLIFFISSARFKDVGHNQKIRILGYCKRIFLNYHFRTIHLQ